MRIAPIYPQLLAALALTAAPAIAQNAAPTGGAAPPPAVDCGNPVTQMDMNFCARNDWEIADAELNGVYAEARAYLRGVDAALPADQQGAADALRDAQRAWITFRDAACAAYAWPMRGGSAEPMQIFACRAQLTRERVEGLRSILAYR